VKEGPVPTDSYVSPVTGLPTWQIDPATGTTYQTGSVVSGDGVVLSSSATPDVPVTGKMRIWTADGITLQLQGAQGVTPSFTIAGLRIVEGTNARMGVATLTAGAATVANTTVTANTRIFLTSQVDGGTPGFLRVSTRTAGTSFTITSSSGTDTSQVAWLLVEPGP
jgi:hypothetical protein